MTISNVSAATQASYQPSAADTTFKNAIEQLAQALQSGNQTAAQQAYATLSQLQAAKSGGQNEPFAQALSQIGDALKAGNLPSAQQALASATQQAQHRGHHHHRSGDGQSAGTTATGDPPSSDATRGVDLTA